MLPTQKSPAPAELKEIWFLQTALCFPSPISLGWSLPSLSCVSKAAAPIPAQPSLPAFRFSQVDQLSSGQILGVMLLFSLLPLTKLCWYFYISEQAAAPHWLTSCQLFFGCLFCDNQLAQTEWALCNTPLLRSQQGGGFHVRLNHEIYIFHFQKQMPQWAPWCLSKAVRSGEAQT